MASGNITIPPAITLDNIKNIKIAGIYITPDADVTFDYSAYQSILFILGRGSTYAMVACDTWGNTSNFSASSSWLSVTVSNKIATVKSNGSDYVRGIAIFIGNHFDMNKHSF